MGLNHRRVGLQPTALPLSYRSGGEGRSRTHKATRAPGLQPGNLAGESLSVKMELTVGLELTSCCLQGSGSRQLSYVSNTVGASAKRARPHPVVVAFPHERHRPNVYTIRIVKEQTGE